jgi:hypothetical protein
MKYLTVVLVGLLIGCTEVTAPPVAKNSEPLIAEGCTAKTSSRLANEHVVGEITNLVKDEREFGYKNQCTVRFDITVNGQIYHLEETREGLEQMASVCYYAREAARKDLLLDLGGKFESDFEMKCKKTDV